jgi:hypothetical protein
MLSRASISKLGSRENVEKQGEKFMLTTWASKHTLNTWHEKRTHTLSPCQSSGPERAAGHGPLSLRLSSGGRSQGRLHKHGGRKRPKILNRKLNPVGERDRRCSMPVLPVVQALLLADHVYEDGVTGKKVIAGTFDCLYAKEFPTHFYSVTNAYVCITEVRGEVPLILRYVDLATNEVLMECGPITISSDDPLASIDFAVQVPPIPMPHEGVFAFELHAFNELLGCLRITVLPEDDEDEDDDEMEESHD